MLVNKAVAKSAVCLVSLCAFHRYSFIRKTKLVNRKRKGRNEEWLVARLFTDGRWRANRRTHN